MIGKQAASDSADPAADTFDLFVVHAAADADFVRGYLLPALDLPSRRVLLLDELPRGSLVASEIAHGVARSRFTVAVLSPAYLDDRWAVFGEQLASHLSLEEVHVIPLRLAEVTLPLHRVPAAAQRALHRAPGPSGDADAVRVFHGRALEVVASAAVMPARSASPRAATSARSASRLPPRPRRAARAPAAPGDVQGARPGR